MKNYTQAPLPFMGQKKRFIKDFKKVLAAYPDDVTIIDLFGGSGLLSHAAKQEKPLAKVVYNDFDGYHKRIENITCTNSLLAQIREITRRLPRNKVIPGPEKEKILTLVKDDKEAQVVDYITLSSSLLFSMKYATSFEELSKATLYNRVRQSPYNADGYLNGLTIVCKDYKELFLEYKGKANVLFLVDPPYLSTEAGTYTMTWSLSDYLDVVTILQETDFIYFTSNKSQIIEFCEWIGRNKIQANPFQGARQININTTLNYSSQYTDIMLYRDK